MNAVNRVWAAVGIYVQAISFLAALFCVFTLGTPQASAANNVLTPTQVGAISSLLVSLNVDQATIEKVKSDLIASPNFAGSAPIPVPLPVLPTSTSTTPGIGVIPLPSPKNPPTIINAPTCTLTASATPVSRNSPKQLTWVSQNATSASTQAGKKTGAPQGSITVSPTEDTTYVKHVYGPGGEGSCQVIIDVKEDTNRSQDTKVVWNLLPSSLMNTINQMQLGAVVLSEELGLADSGQ